MLRHFVLRTVREKLLCACCLCTKVVPCIPTMRPCPIWPPPQPVPLLPFPLLFLTENTHVPSLCSSSTKPWRRNPSKPTKSTTSSSEFDGRPIKDDADELHHHLDHLFLAEDLGEGHPQASPLFPQAFKYELDSIYTDASLLQQVALRLCSTHRCELLSLFPFTLVPSSKIPSSFMASRHWWPRSL